jgi:hypothetical protein
MSILSLEAYNKNQYRKYPLKQSSSLTAINGHVVSDHLIVACNFASTYGKHRLYIKQIFHKFSSIRIAVASCLDDTVLGYFSGQVTENNTTLEFLPFSKFLDGNITIGSLEAFNALPELLNFKKEAMEVEESTIFCYPPPAVTNIIDKNGTELRGNVRFGSLTNLTKTNGTNTAALQVTNAENIFNLADKSSYLDNCPTPIIRSINSATPFPVGTLDEKNDGNIYMVGINPIVFYGIPKENAEESQSGVLNVDSPTLTLDSLCALKHVLLPPVDISGFTVDSEEFKNKYYSKPAMIAKAADSMNLNYPLERPARYASNFNATQLPEFYFWPQFVKEEYYNNWPVLEE